MSSVTHARRTNVRTNVRRGQTHVRNSPKAHGVADRKNSPDDRQGAAEGRPLEVGGGRGGQFARGDGGEVRKCACVSHKKRDMRKGNRRTQDTVHRRRYWA